MTLEVDYSDMNELGGQSFADLVDTLAEVYNNMEQAVTGEFELANGRIMRIENGLIMEVV